MAYSPDIYTGDGATTVFTVTFPYLETSHVVVTLDGVVKTETTDYTWSSSTQIDFTPSGAPGSGVEVKFARSTPTDRIVDFQDAGNLTEAKLDLDANQLAYVMQEISANFSDKLGRSASDSTVWDGETSRLTNLADPTADQDAATRGWVNTALAAGGAVPTPANPADNDKVIRATGGTWTWYAFLTDWISDAAAFMKTFIKSADAATARTNLGAGTTGSTLFTDTTAAGARTTLGLGDSATKNVDTAGGVQGYDGAVRLTGAQTVAGDKTISGKMTFNGGTAGELYNQGSVTAGTVTLVLTNADDFKMTLTGNITLAMSGAAVGQCGVIYITQDGTGGRTVAYSSYFEFEEGITPTVSANASEMSVLIYHVRAVSAGVPTNVTARLLTAVA